MKRQIDWRRIQKGDKAVFDQMFDMYYQPLCVFVSSYINNSQVVEDIVIDCFTKIWEDRASLEVKASLGNFLITVAKNATIDYLRKNKMKYAELENIPDSLIEENVHVLEEADLLNDLYESINKLPEQRRRILKMAAFEEKSYKEIAQELDISLNTVKTQMSRAYKFLKEQLNVNQRRLKVLLLVLKAFIQTC